MHGEFLQDLALVLTVAGVVTAVFHRLKQPVVLGYILAGLIVGPHTKVPLLVHDRQTVEMLAELGVILLMFALGLHFSLRQLARVGPTAFVAATLIISVMIAVGYAVGRVFAWRTMDSLFLGAILSISSTTIIVKALTDLGKSREPFAELVFGILVVEDVLAIAMLALLSGIAATGSLAIGAVLLTLGKLAVFLASVLVFGLLLVPPLLRRVNRFGSGETLLIVALALCFGVSLLAMRLGYSVALGAFLIGAVVAEARERGKIETLVEPVRDMFSAVFFVAVGMLIEPPLLLKYAGPIAVISAAVIVGQVTTSVLGILLTGHPPRVAVRAGLSLAQIGEFSFIIAQLGQTLHVTSDFLYPIAVTVSAVTTLVSPYLIRAADPLVDLAARVIPSRVYAPLSNYQRWVRELTTAGAATDNARVRKLLRKWVMQMLLNLALVTAIFVAAAGFVAYATPRWRPPPTWAGGPRGLPWLSAVLLSSPLLIVTVRKLRAVSLVLAEMAAPKRRLGDRAARLQAAIAGTVRTTGLVIVGVWVLLLSAALLPPWHVSLVLLAVVALVMAFRWQSLERFYARAQIALHETLTAPVVDDHAAHEPVPPPLPAMLRGATIETVAVPLNSLAAGKLIRELQLRTRSGATVVGIERAAGADLLNPGPDEEIAPGDRVVLLGHPPQLQAARNILAGDAVAPSASSDGV